MTDLDVTMLDGVTGGVKAETCREYDRIADALARSNYPLRSKLYRQEAANCRADLAGFPVVGVARRWLGL